MAPAGPPPIKPWLWPCLVAHNLFFKTTFINNNLNIKEFLRELNFYVNEYTSTVKQWFSNYGTRAICGILTKKLWHFAFIFT